MTDLELREKIINVLSGFKITAYDDKNEYLFEKNIPKELLENIADVLIAEGIGQFHNFIPIRGELLTSQKSISIYFESKEDEKLFKKYLENAPTLDLVNYFKKRAESYKKALKGLARQYVLLRGYKTNQVNFDVDGETIQIFLNEEDEKQQEDKK